MRRSMLVWVRAVMLVAAVAGVASACGSTGGTGGTAGGGSSACTPGDQKGCACPGGSQGVQVCADDGRSYKACQCGSGTSTGQGGSLLTTTGAQMGACGDGVAQQGECDPGSEFYCPKDCTDGGMGGASSTSSTGTGDACTGHIYFAGIVPSVPSIWTFNGMTSFDAGNEMCKAMVGADADHVCDYDEMLAADKDMEFKDIAQGSNFWVNRTTPAMVNGMTSAPGPGGRCNDWKYGTNHISDGEYATFDTKGVINFHLDNDTFFDGVDTTHTITNDLQCGGVPGGRSIMCCYKKCK